MSLSSEASTIAEIMQDWREITASVLFRLHFWLHLSLVQKSVEKEPQAVEMTLIVPLPSLSNLLNASLHALTSS